MSKMSRNKGSAAEREILRWFFDTFEVIETKPKRNLTQSRGGGADCLTLPGIALEVKRQEQLSVQAWWEQAVRQAISAERMPVLCYRQNRRRWVFCIPASLITAGSWGYISLTEGEFTLWYANCLQTEFN